MPLQPLPSSRRRIPVSNSLLVGDAIGNRDGAVSCWQRATGCRCRDVSNVRIPAPHSRSAKEPDVCPADPRVESVPAFLDLELCAVLIACGVADAALNRAVVQLFRRAVVVLAPKEAGAQNVGILSSSMLHGDGDEDNVTARACIISRTFGWICVPVELVVRCSGFVGVVSPMPMDEPSRAASGLQSCRLRPSSDQGRHPQRRR